MYLKMENTVEQSSRTDNPVRGKAFYRVFHLAWDFLCLKGAGNERKTRMVAG